MSGVLLFARLSLCAVFLIAGLAKLRDRAGSRESMIAFGIPPAVAGLFGISLPIAEVLVACAMIPASFALVGATGALTLLILFLIVIAVNIARGCRPSCHCFGQLQSKPIGWGLAARNLALIAVAVMVIHAGSKQPSFRNWVGELKGHSDVNLVGIAVFCVLALLLFQTWLLFQLVKQGGRVLIRLEALEKQVSGRESASNLLAARGLPLDEKAPEFALETVERRLVSLEQLRGPGKPLLLLFWSPSCGPCIALLDQLAAWTRDLSSYLTVALISPEIKGRNLTDAHENGDFVMLVDPQNEVRNMYKVTGTPSALFVRADGNIGSSVASGAEAIQLLLATTISRPANAPTLRRPHSIP